MTLKSELLKDKICMVTGSSRGIGFEITKTLALAGGIVYANARKVGCLELLCEEIEAQGTGKIIPQYFDITDLKASKSAIMQIKKENGRLDVLVNNAGMMKDALIGMIPHELIKDTFEVNVFGMMELIQLATKIMVRQKSGSIINMASIVGANGNAGQMVYSASKGAVIALTKTAAKELAPNNIRVNAIAPGMIDTEMFRSIGEERVKERLDHIKMGRLGTPQDIANTCLYLGSNLSAYVTGQIIGVDGSALI